MTFTLSDLLLIAAIVAVVALIVLIIKAIPAIAPLKRILDNVADLTDEAKAGVDGAKKLALSISSKSGSAVTKVLAAAVGLKKFFNKKEK